MKHSNVCIISSLLLLILVAGAFFNARYLNRTVTDIIRSIDDLPDDALSAKERIIDLRDFWEERKQILKFTISDSSLNAISLLFDEVIIAIQNADNEEYQKATARLRRAVENINQLEKIALSNIF